MWTGPDLSARAAGAVARAVAFLSQSRRDTGELMVRTWAPARPEWLYDPSIFATALITQSLRNVAGTEELRHRACDFIESQREGFGVWRHWTRGHAQFHYVPPDLDDTAMACVALSQNGRRVPDNRALFVANRDPRGLFFSWISLRRRWVPSVAYWWISLIHMRHPLYSTRFYHITPSARWDVDAVVNANVLFYLGFSRETEAVVPFLLRILHEQRETTCDKWYDNPFVVWYFFSRALRAAGADARTVVLERLHEARPGSALERALAICIRLDWAERPDDDALGGLLDAQLPTGGWPLAPVYKGRNVRWGSEELTTGFCIEAIDRWLKLGEVGA